MAIFRLLQFSQKLSIRFERIFLLSFSTPYYAPMCAISINSYDWDSSESEGKRPKATPLPHTRLWFCIQRVAPSILLKSLRYIRIKALYPTFDVISELFCVLLRRMRSSKTEVFHENVIRIF